MNLESGKWYMWTGSTGSTLRPIGWNSSGYMDFMLDGKPHRCRSGSGHDGAFDDSPHPDREWSWRSGFEYIKEVSDPTSKIVKPPVEEVWTVSDIRTELFNRL